MNGESTYQEIVTQPVALVDALAAFGERAAALRPAWQRLAPRQVIFTGCGSTHYLALTAAALFRGLTGVPAAGHPASDLLFFEEIITSPRDCLLVAISRSGTTTETLQTVERLRQRGIGGVWTITCEPDSPLAHASDLTLPAAAAREESIAQTRSFSSMLLLAQALAAHLGGEDWTVLRQTPGSARFILETQEALVEQVGHRLQDDRVYFLGSGPHYGIASEAMLKMTEMSLTVSQAFHFLEFRHGPMSMVQPGAELIGMLTPQASRHELQVLREMRERGAHTLALGPMSVDSGATWAIDLPGEYPAWALPVLYMPVVQLLAFHRARAKGLDPDNPRHLAAVIHLDPAALLS